MELHQLLLAEIKQHQSIGPKHEWVKKYLGTIHTFYGVPTETKRRIAKQFAKEHPEITFSDFEKLLDQLFAGKSVEEKNIACYLLEYFPKLRLQLNPQKIDQWLNDLVGWQEIDTLCAGPFKAKDLQNSWNEWKELLEKLNQSENISKRRASIVLLVVPLRDPDPRFAALAIANFTPLISEKNILITKAVSWVMRAMIKHHRHEVEEYLEQNYDSISKIALREVTRKLETGKK